MPLDPARTVAELEELRELTGDEDGAQRVAWTETWEQAREWLRGKRRARRAREERSTRPATSGSRCRGESERALLIGGHIDSVPNGGWLDGCLNVVAGVEVLRRIAAEGTPPVTVRLVNWADEEGARFGRSLFGSSAAAGSMRDQDELRKLDGPRRRSRFRTRCASTASISTARSTRARSSRARRPTSSCTSSRARCSSRSTCRSASCSARSASSATGSPGAARPRTPARRRWTSAATRSPARRSSRSRSARSRRAVGDGAVCTSGGVVCRPGIVTSVVETAEQLLDQRHLDAAKLASHARAGARRRASASPHEENDRGRVGADLVDRADPLRRDADRLLRRGGPRGRRHRRTGSRRARCTTRPRSSRAGVPTVMLFVQSLRGLSHTKLEDTKHEHLELAVVRRSTGSRRRRSPGSPTAAGVAGSDRASDPVAAVVRRASQSARCLTWNVSNVGAVADPLAGALRRVARGDRPPDDGALRHAPRRTAPRGPGSRPFRLTASRPARDRRRGGRERARSCSTPATRRARSAAQSSGSARARASSRASTSFARAEEVRCCRGSTEARRWPAVALRS